MRATKTVKKKINNLKFENKPFLNLRTCFFKRLLKVELSLAFLTYVHLGNKFQSFAAKNENDLGHHSSIDMMC